MKGPKNGKNRHTFNKYNVLHFRDVYLCVPRSLSTRRQGSTSPLMGQQLGREEVASSAAYSQQHARSSHDRSFSSTAMRRAKGGGQRDLLSVSDSPLAAQASAGPSISSKTKIDGGFVVRQGIYNTRTDFDDQKVRQLIVERKLSPFFVGAEDEDDLQGAPVSSECPICFLVRRFLWKAFVCSCSWP